MYLKIKSLKWEAGRPVAILNTKSADENSIHVDDRISIIKEKKEVIAVVDTALEILKENEIILSKEVIKSLHSQKGKVEIKLAEKPRSVELIHKKINKEILSVDELKEIMKDVAKNALTESEIAYLISSIYNSKMSLKEIADLTKAIVETGQVLKFKGKVADKHSIGGIPGRTTPIIVSICSCTGLKIPKTSSRAITTPAGTADAMETICKVDFSASEVKKIVNKINACLVWGGSVGLAPADDKIIQVERLLNLDPESQLLASIMAKKISVGAKYILIDIPYGKTAKVNKNRAIKLKNKFEKLGKYFHKEIKAVLSKADEPTGNGVGPALEIIDVIKVLKREDKCNNLEEKSLKLSAELLELSKVVKKGQGLKLAKQILDSGKAYNKFEQIVKAQKGSLKNLNKSKFKFSREIESEKSGKLYLIDIKKINSIAREIGCPLDKYAGLYLHKHVGDLVRKNEKIVTIYAESKIKLNSASKLFHKLKPFQLR